MSEVDSHKYIMIWIWLLILVLVAVGATWLLPKVQALVLIFTVAVIKAFLVARNYMHLKHEKVIIYAFALVPLAFVIILFFALFPDFVFHR